MANKESQKELAQILFMNGTTQLDIAGKIGVSKQTVNKWVKEGCWAERRAAKTASRKEIVAGMLSKLDEKITAGEWTPDEVAKTAAAIEKIDKQTNIITVIEVFSAYNQWLVSRMAIDPELTPELVKIMNRYQDIFIGEKLNTIQIPEIG